MRKDQEIEKNFEDMLTMLKNKIHEKDNEIKRLEEENKKLKDALPEGYDVNAVLDETFKRR